MDEACAPEPVKVREIIWKCPFCGRDKFDRKYQPHRCRGGYRKSFRVKKVATLMHDQMPEAQKKLTWHFRKSKDGWWDVYSAIDDSFVIARCPNSGNAWLISNMLNGGIQIRSSS